MQLLIILDKEKPSNDSEIYVPAEGYDYGYALIYGDSSTFLIILNYGAYPFVYHPSFTFQNTDGSTFEKFSPYFLSVSGVKKFFKNKTLEYLFYQSH